MDVRLFWCDYAGNVETLALQQPSRVRDLHRAFLKKHTELSSTTHLLISYRGKSLASNFSLGELETTSEDPIKIEAGPRMRRVWYRIANMRSGKWMRQTWVPMTCNISYLRETVLRENSDLPINISADRLEVYSHHWARHEFTDPPLAGDTWIGGYGYLDDDNCLTVKVVRKARGDLRLNSVNPLLRLRTTLDTIAFGLSTVYEFDHSSTASIDDIILSMDGYWKYVIADRTEVRQKGVDGPTYVVVKDFPLTGMRLNEVYTREEWDVLGLASLVLRNEEIRNKYLKQGLLDAVEAIANKEYWC